MELAAVMWDLEDEKDPCRRDVASALNEEVTLEASETTISSVQFRNNASTHIYLSFHPFQTH